MATIKKIRIGNDFSFAWAIERNGLPEDLSGAFNMILRLRNSLGAIQTITDYTVTGNVVSVDVTPAMAKTLGKYVFILTYELPDAGLTDLERMCEVDTDAFVIVPRTAEADDSKDLLVASDMAIGFRGKDAYEVWLETNSGTREDYLASIKGDTGNYGVVEFVINENMELEQRTLAGEPLNFAIVDNDLVLTNESETINLGQVGQSSVPTYTDTIYRADAVYVNNHIRFKQTNLLCDVKSLVVRNSYGDITADAKIVYNGGYALIYSELLSKSANWEFFTIAYNLVPNDKTYLPDLRGKIGRNYVQDEYEAGSHSNNNTNHFLSVYHQFGGTERQALKSQEIQNADISWDETDEWAVKAKFNIVGRPYVQGATAEEISSCPDILSIGSHCGNYYYTGAIAANNHGVLNADPLLNIGDRKDITENENTFLKNTIAITCGEKLDGTGLWCSYGYGVEFFEAMEGLVERYPEKNIYAARALMFSLDARTLTTTAHTGWVTRNNDQVGDKIYLHGETIQEAIITEIVDASTVKIDRDITIASPGVYMWNYCYLQNLTGTQPQQSATCSWVAAKLALIQDFTDANWQLVREAARMTASNSTMVETGGVKVYTTHWDMKRGFGMIDVTKAVEYIEDNYINNQEYKDSVIPSLPVYNPFLKVDDLDDNNPITKKQLLEAIAITQYADEFGDIIIHPNLLIAKYTDTFGDILI